MILMWYHHGNLLVPNNVLYELGVQMGEKVYLIGFKRRVPGEESNFNGLIVSELDLNIMKITQLIFVNIRLFGDRVSAYSENIIIVDSMDESPSIKFAIINTKSRQVENRTVHHSISNGQIVCTCIVDDQIYISLISNQRAAKLSILLVNLKTWRTEFIERPNAPLIISNTAICNLKAFNYGTDVFFIGSYDLTVSIFNTETKTWTKCADHLVCLNSVYDNTVYNNGEVFNFRHSSDPSSKQWVDVFNFTSLSWRREKVSLPTAYNSAHCSKCFAFNRKIFYLKNSNNAINEVYSSHFEEEYSEFIPNSDMLDIFELDLNPSLERLYIMNLVNQNLSIDKVPHFMKNDFQRYVKETRTPAVEV